MGKINVCDEIVIESQKKRKLYINIHLKDGFRIKFDTGMGIVVIPW